MRPDVDTDDPALMIALLLRPALGLRAELTRRNADRCLALMLDSLRARDDAQPLLAREIAVTDLDPGA
ncbi:hypothetical protein [Streptomyces sp. NPDC048248]|uniref:hypothetical protein n=1 Tax=Streptomyces sp. NPDC048248 TaxID=3365523 RepID=UPI00371A7033